jgi:hypothetical protein
MITRISSIIWPEGLGDLLITHITAGTRADAWRKLITLGDPLDLWLETRVGSCQDAVPMPGAGSGILRTWKPAGARSSACAPPWTCTT